MESELGKSSRFWFSVPLRVLQQNPPANGFELKLAGRCVVIADENEARGTSLAGLVGSYNIDCRPCNGAETCLDALNNPSDTIHGLYVSATLLRDHEFALARALSETRSGKDLKLVVFGSARDLNQLNLPEDVDVAGELTFPVRQSAVLDSLAILLGEEMPAAAQVKTINASEDRKKKDARKKYRILIAEDNPVNQKVAAHMLRKLGYRYQLVGNGLEALSALEDFTFDLILMDCQMPDTDGFEASSVIRKLDPPTNEIPIVALPANAMKGDREACLNAGMNDYITKPIKPDMLRSVLEKYLN